MPVMTYRASQVVKVKFWTERTLYKGNWFIESLILFMK